MGTAGAAGRRALTALLVTVVALAPASLVVASADAVDLRPTLREVAGRSVTSSEPSRSSEPAHGSELVGVDEGVPVPPVSAESLEEATTGTPGWQIPPVLGRAPGLAAYADRVSVLPGETFGLYVDTPLPAAVSVRALRIGPYSGAGAREVWRGTAAGRVQPAATMHDSALTTAGDLRNSHLVEASWALGARISTAGWPEGHYLLRLDLDAADGGSPAAARYVPLTVRSIGARGRVLVVAGAMTWQAYNVWGGASLYGGDEGAGTGAHATAVSFDRPYADGFGSGRFLTYDAPVAVAAQGLGLALAWATDVDLAEHPDLVDGAAAVVIGGHAEYWTAGMRDVVEAAVASGTNLAVFGANTAYWRVRLVAGTSASTPGDRVMVTTKSSSADPLAARDPHGATGRFRDPPMARPEEDLTGLRYDCFPASAAWTVADPHWWGYRGAGVTAGMRLEGLVGPESDRVYDVPRRTRPTHVVAYTTFGCGHGTTAHTAAYSVRPSGAAVFDVGTMHWPCALQRQECRYVPDPRARAVVRTITENVLAQFSTPRAGQRYPAVDDVDRYWLPATSTTGAS